MAVRRAPVSLLAVACSLLVHALVLLPPFWQFSHTEVLPPAPTLISATLLPAPQMLSQPVPAPAQQNSPPAPSQAQTPSPQPKPEPAGHMASTWQPETSPSTESPALAEPALEPGQPAQAALADTEAAEAQPAWDTSAWPQQGRVLYQSSYWGVPVTGEQRWKHDGSQYTASLRGSVPVKGELLHQRAAGSIVGGRPVSSRFTEVFNRGEYDTQFAADGSSVYQVRKGSERSVETGAYALDMLALTHFMAMQPADAASFDVFVVTFRGSVSRVTVQQQPAVMLDLPAGRTLARHFHAQGQQGKLRIDVWLSADWRNAPVRIRVEDQDGAYDLRAREVEIDGQVLARQGWIPEAGGD